MVHNLKYNDELYQFSSTVIVVINGGGVSHPHLFSMLPKVTITVHGMKTCRFLHLDATFHVRCLYYSITMHLQYDSVMQRVQCLYAIGIYSPIKRIKLFATFATRRDWNLI